MMKVYCQSSMLFLVVATVVVLMVMPLVAFSGGPDPKEMDAIDDTYVVCSEPRSQMCTMDYRPVCAQLENDQSKTYSNGCTACADAKVSSYRDGACEEEK